jgi:hypothetical protein
MVCRRRESRKNDAVHNLVADRAAKVRGTVDTLLRGNHVHHLQIFVRHLARTDVFAGLQSQSGEQGKKEKKGKEESE